jgi:exonuclease III
VAGGTKVPSLLRGQSDGPSATIMHIILLNIRHGGGLRAQRILDWLDGHSPDLIVMPEWRDSAPGQLIKGNLEAAGFYVATACAVGRRSNGILVAAKEPFRSRRVTPMHSQKGELILADLASGCRLLAAYFPQGKAKGSFFDDCMGETARSDAAPFLLLGDLNTGRNDADVQGSGVPFVCADMFDELQTNGGLVDLWRNEHGAKQEWSWRSPLNGFRIDHALANTAFRKHFSTIRCMYDHAPRETSLTDHSALILIAE